MKRVRSRARAARLSSHAVAGLMVVCIVASFAFIWLKPSRSEAIKLDAVPAHYTLNLSGPVSPASAGIILAISDGLFAREGLSVRVVAGSGDDDAIAAVIANENTIGIASAAGFLKARSEGNSIIAFAGSYAVSPVEFFTLPDITLLQPSDLEGKRIGFKRGLEASAILYEFVAKNALAQSKLLLIESDSPLQDLLHRRIDVLLGRLDLEGQELARLNLEYNTLSPAAYGVYAAGPVFFVQERTFARRRNLEKFLLAVADGWNAAYENYDRSIPIIANAIATPLSRSLISRLMDKQRSFLRPFGARFGELDPRHIRLLQAQLLRRRIMQEPVDLTRAIDHDILKQAYRSDATNLSHVER